MGSVHRSDDRGPSAAASYRRKGPQLSASGDAATFVADVSVPDGTVMPPHREFEKTWRIRNGGTAPWIGRWLARRGSASGHGVPTSSRRVHVPDTMPGEKVDVSVPVRSQPWPRPQRISRWMMTRVGSTSPGRYSLGLVLSIIVAGPVTSAFRYGDNAPEVISAVRQGGGQSKRMHRNARSGIMTIINSTRARTLTTAITATTVGWLLRESFRLADSKGMQIPRSVVDLAPPIAGTLITMWLRHKWDPDQAAGY
jgi:hypothetical protein